jgi:hypothetical protein
MTKISGAGHSSGISIDDQDDDDEILAQEQAAIASTSVSAADLSGDTAAPAPSQQASASKTIGRSGKADPMLAVFAAEREQEQQQVTSKDDV